RLRVTAGHDGGWSVCASQEAQRQPMRLLETEPARRNLVGACVETCSMESSKESLLAKVAPGESVGIWILVAHEPDAAVAQFDQVTSGHCTSGQVVGDDGRQAHRRSVDKDDRGTGGDERGLLLFGRSKRNDDRPIC